MVLKVDPRLGGGGGGGGGGHLDLFLDLEGSLDVSVHHFHICLIDAQGALRKPAGLVDGYILQPQIFAPALLQDEQ